MKSSKTLFTIYAVLAIVLGARPAWADKAGDALLQKCVDAEGKAQTLAADFTHLSRLEGQTRVQTGKIQIKKPNFAHIVITAPKNETSGNVVIHSDGRQFLTYSPSDNTYAQEAADVSGGNIARNNIVETNIFFNPDLLNRYRFMGSGAKIVGSVTVGGTACKILEITGIPKNNFRITIGADGLLRGSLHVWGDSRDETHLTNLRANSAIAPAAFVWKMPRGAKTVQEVVSSHAAETQGQRAVSLLAVGKIAPDFTLTQLSGQSVSLSTLLKANKVVLVNFWANYCGPCHEELPHLNKLHEDLKSKGFEILTINLGDSAAVVSKFWTESHFTLRVALNGDKVSTQYGVQAIPTNYVIGSDGKILGAFEGFDESGIRTALAKAGIK